VIGKHRLATTTCAAAVSLGAAAAAGAAQEPERHAADQPAPPKPRVALFERPSQRFERVVEAHRVGTRLESLRERAEKLNLDPGGPAPDSTRKLREQVRRLAPIVRRAEREAADRDAAEREYGTVAGVSQGTLDAIAACESGGDPTAVNPAGYYGKYQFDLGTWASVGGSGNPAEAPEAEQDYRAALLLSRAGASPWPVCGA